MKLIGVAILCGIFTGIRGGLFSVAMWRLKVRICSALFASLLAQEIGFFDKVQTGWFNDGSFVLLVDNLSLSIAYHTNYHFH